MMRSASAARRKAKYSSTKMIASVAGTTILSFAVARSRNSNWPDQEIEVPAGRVATHPTPRCISSPADRGERKRGLGGQSGELGGRRINKKKKNTRREHQQ